MTCVTRPTAPVAVTAVWAAGAFFATAVLAAAAGFSAAAFTAVGFFTAAVVLGVAALAIILTLFP
jgi:hypothetical protein